MAAPYPVSVRLGASPPAFIVDAGFALSPMGLLVTMALARTAAVWLPRGLLSLLDNDHLYRRSPELMGGEWLSADTRPSILRAMAEELPAWQRAWHYGKLAARVHWIGDMRHESALADRDEASLLPRFEHCAAALDARFALRQGHDLAPLEECARDAVALTAALQPDPVLLLSHSDGRGDTPPLCAMLEDLGFTIRRRSGCGGQSALAFAEPAIVALEASEGHAALVQLAAPAVLTLPESWDDPDWHGDDHNGPDTDTGNDVWRNACALWQPLESVV